MRAGGVPEVWEKKTEVRYLTALSVIDKERLNRGWTLVDLSLACWGGRTVFWKAMRTVNKLSLQKFWVACEVLNIEVYVVVRGQARRVCSFSHVARLLRQERKEQSLSQTAVAARLGRGKNTVYDWENNLQRPLFCVMIAWMLVLGCDFLVRPGGTAMAL